MMRVAAAVLVLAALAGCTAGPAADRVAIGTWNMEWLIAPDTFDALAGRCLGEGRRARGSDRVIPCNLVPRARWDDAELARLREFAAALPLDVIALQEVDGEEAARLVFTTHDFCFTQRRHVQNVGFAIRRGIPHRCNEDYRALGLADDDVRWGADLTLYPGSSNEMRLLAVHLKSGCNRDPLEERRRDCHVLQDQVPVLEDWIDRRARARERFIVIGDFNRRFDREGRVARNERGKTIAMWPEIDDGDPAGADLVNAGERHGMLSCLPGSQPRWPIDYIVLGSRLAPALVPGSFRVWPYPDRSRWPDHCLISVELQLEARHGL